MILGKLNYEGRSCRSDQVVFAPSINDMTLLMCADNCTVTQSNLLPESYETDEDWRSVCVSSTDDSTIIPGFDVGWPRTIIDDLQAAWVVLLSSVLVSLVLTIVVGVLLKYLAGCVIVVSVLSVSVGGGITGYFLYTGSIGEE